MTIKCKHCGHELTEIRVEIRLCKDCTIDYRTLEIKPQEKQWDYNGCVTYCPKCGAIFELDKKWRFVKLLSFVAE